MADSVARRCTEKTGCSNVLRPALEQAVESVSVPAADCALLLAFLFSLWLSPVSWLPFTLTALIAPLPDASATFCSLVADSDSSFSPLRLKMMVVRGFGVTVVEEVAGGKTASEADGVVGCGVAPK
jgi:hypothetical protein